MPSPVLVAAIAAAVGALGASGVALRPGGSDLARGSGAHAPVIREPFTPLPCSGSPGHQTTLQEEGCAEQRIGRSDTQINALSASIFSLLSDPGSRRDFIAAQQAWLRYRKADCLSRSDQFRGGTLAALLDAHCTAERSAQRVTQLRTFRTDLSRSG